MFVPDDDNLVVRGMVFGAFYIKEEYCEVELSAYDEKGIGLLDE